MVKRDYVFYIGLYDNHTAKTEGTVSIEFEGNETIDEIDDIVRANYDEWVGSVAEFTYWLAE